MNGEKNHPQNAGLIVSLLFIGMGLFFVTTGKAYIEGVPTEGTAVRIGGAGIAAIGAVLVIRALRRK